MLSVHDIAERIVQPEKVNAKDIEALAELSGKYPYSQILPILYLKGLGNSGDIRFDEELKRNSYRIGDRVQLYHLIEDYSADVVTEEKVDASVEPESEITTDEIQAIEPIIETAQEEVSVAPVEDIKIEEETSEVEAFETVEPVIETAEPEVEEESIVVPQDGLEESILHNIYANNYQLDELSEEEDQELNERNSNKNIEAEVSAESSEESIDIDTQQSFTSWLHSDQNYAEEANLDKIAIEAIVNEFEDFNPSSDLFGEIEKPKKEFFSPTKKAKESLDEDSLPVSETLAKIYALQGNYPKAIQAFEELSLIYPEKKIFFANQIRDLKAKLNTL
jgi:hypothetical protein